MATNTKTRQNKPPNSSYGLRRLAPRRDTTTPSGRSAPADSQRLVRRVQTILPGAKRSAKSSPAKAVSAAVERATGAPRARAPLTKGTFGILIGRGAAAAVANRRHNLGPHQVPATSSAQGTNAGAEDTSQRLENIAVPSATTGGHHGDFQGPGPAPAA